MRKIIIDTFELKELIELLKLYGADTNEPVITDLAWQMDDVFFNTKAEMDVKNNLTIWSAGQIQFREPKSEE
jgi:hypothetical protein